LNIFSLRIIKETFLFDVTFPINDNWFFSKKLSNFLLFFEFTVTSILLGVSEKRIQLFSILEFIE